jgi:hypothetical protein
MGTIEKDGERGWLELLGPKIAKHSRFLEE